jgi:hypothetical protein
VPTLVKRFRQLPIYKVIEHGRFYEQLEPLLGQGDLDAIRKGWQRFVDPLGGILTGRLAVASWEPYLVSDPHPSALFDGVLILAEIGENEAALTKYLEENVYPWLEEVEGLGREKVVVQGVVFTRLEDPESAEPGLQFAVIDGVLVVASASWTSEALMEGLMGAWSAADGGDEGEAPGRLADNTWYAKARKEFERADVFEFVNMGHADRMDHKSLAKQDALNRYQETWGVVHAVSGLEPLEAISRQRPGAA